jgi:hypothetical protein
MPQTMVFGMAGNQGAHRPPSGEGGRHPLWLEQQDEHNGDGDEEQDRDDHRLATPGLAGLSRVCAAQRRLVSGRERRHGPHPVARVERRPPTSVL